MDGKCRERLIFGKTVKKNFEYTKPTKTMRCWKNFNKLLDKKL